MPRRPQTGDFPTPEDFRLWPPESLRRHAHMLGFTITITPPPDRPVTRRRLEALRIDVNLFLDAHCPGAPRFRYDVAPRIGRRQFADAHAWVRFCTLRDRFISLAANVKARRDAPVWDVVTPHRDPSGEPITHSGLSTPLVVAMLRDHQYDGWEGMWPDLARNSRLARARQGAALYHALVEERFTVPPWVHPRAKATTPREQMFRFRGPGGSHVHPLQLSRLLGAAPKWPRGWLTADETRVYLNRTGCRGPYLLPTYMLAQRRVEPMLFTPLSRYDPDADRSPTLVTNARWQRRFARLPPRPRYLSGFVEVPASRQVSGH